MSEEKKKAEEILDEEISDSLKNILEQSDTPEELKSFKRYILDAMERYKNQPALPTKEKELLPPDATYTRQQIESLQTRIHKIVGNGQVMAEFNQLLGINAA